MHTVDILVYIDDMIITESDQTEIDKLLSVLGKEYKVRDLGQFNFFLAVQVQWTSDSILLDQQQYLFNFLKQWIWTAWNQHLHG